MAEEVFNPWEIKGDIDYDKLVKNFGIEPLKKLLTIFNENIFCKNFRNRPW